MLGSVCRSGWMAFYSRSKGAASVQKMGLVSGASSPCLPVQCCTLPTAAAMPLQSYVPLENLIENLLKDEKWRRLRLVRPLSGSTAASRRLLNPILACRFFQYMTFYMIALQLVQFSLAVVADCLPLVSTSLHDADLLSHMKSAGSSPPAFDASGLHSVMTPRRWVWAQDTAQTAHEHSGASRPGSKPLWVWQQASVAAILTGPQPVLLHSTDSRQCGTSSTSAVACASFHPFAALQQHL